MIPLVLLSLILADPRPPEVPLERLGTLAHSPIHEASGIVRSRQYPGVFWVHNDSGNPPALFAVRRDGTLIREYSVKIPNIDWEDIATDDHGHLYIGDIGNNDNRLPLRAVYRLDEPDPFLDKEPALTVDTASYYRFPENGRFDAEALVIDGPRALIIAKTFDGRDAEIYAIPFHPPAPLLRPAIPEKIGTLDGFNQPVTGADLTPDGKRLVICSLKTFGVYQKNAGGTWTRRALRSFNSGDQIEAVAWDGDDIILAGEDRGIFRVGAAAWKSHDE